MRIIKFVCYKKATDGRQVLFTEPEGDQYTWNSLWEKQQTIEKFVGKIQVRREFAANFYLEQSFSTPSG